MARWDDDDEEGQFELVESDDPKPEAREPEWSPCEEYGHDFSQGRRCLTCGESMDGP
jgi:hypothetical protein